MLSARRDKNINGYETMHILRKSQVKRLAPEDASKNVKLIEGYAKYKRDEGLFDF